MLAHLKTVKQDHNLTLPGEGSSLEQLLLKLKVIFPLTSNMQVPEGARGSQPRRALARELFPAPVGPTMMMRGSGRLGITFQF